ncbi:MAG: hypothetical protein R3282_05055 [Rhodothermales bacterium]|nr:hypothetical protein [Rhodothermales bacterium]
MPWRTPAVMDERARFVFEADACRKIGLERIADDLWGGYFGKRHLGWLDESDFRIMKLRRRQRSPDL